MAQPKIVKTPKIKKALEVATESFRGFWRKDGRPTIQHILDVLNVVVKSPHNFTIDEICALILHDIIEDTNMIYKELIAMFGGRIAYLVLGLSKPKDMDTITYYEFLKEVLSPVCIAMKLCDVVANLESLEGCDDHEWVQRFKNKIINYGFPLLDVLRMHGDEWGTHANYIQERMEAVLGPKPVIEQ